MKVSRNLASAIGLRANSNPVSDNHASIFNLGDHLDLQSGLEQYYKTKNTDSGERLFKINKRIAAKNRR